VSAGQKVASDGGTSGQAEGETSAQSTFGLWSKRSRRPRPVRADAFEGSVLIWLVPAIIVLCMLALGVQLNAHVRARALDEFGKTDDYNSDVILAPLLQSAEAPLSQSQIAALDAALAAPPISRNLVAAKIWALDGTIIYATDRELIGQVVLSPEVERARRGTVTAQFDEPADSDGAHQAHATPRVEVYAPVRIDGRIAFVSEFYHDGAALAAQLRATAIWVWSAIGVATGLMLFLLFLIGWRGRAVILAQQAEIRRRLRTAERLARRNLHLKHEAEVARSDAIRTNQSFLSSLGSHLHDGPVQLLTLLILQLSSRAPGGDRQASDDQVQVELAQSVLGELRGLAHGLVLPELEDLDTRATIALAVERHSAFTGTEVAVTISEDFPERLDDAIKVCLYRIVQEGLNNAFKHAGGEGQRVSARTSGQRLVLEIVNMQAEAAPSPSATPQGGLGLLGLRRQVKAVSGTIEMSRMPQGETKVIATLPTSLVGSAQTPNHEAASTG
jgi:signal transduction histidine kinase